MFPRQDTELQDKQQGEDAEQAACAGTRAPLTPGCMWIWGIHLILLPRVKWGQHYLPWRSLVRTKLESIRLAEC